MIERDYVLKYLQDKQEKEGGYTGNDLTEFAKQLCVTSRGLRKRISNSSCGVKIPIIEHTNYINNFMQVIPV
jgi:hypothetical protein